MKIMEFAFDPREAGNYLPHTYTNHCVAYTGTHDNNTLLAWLDELDEEAIAFMDEYMGSGGHAKEEKVWDVIRLTLACVADLAVIPMQDYLVLGKEARINQPSTLGNNWTWRMAPGAFTDELAERIGYLTNIFGR